MWLVWWAGLTSSVCGNAISYCFLATIGDQSIGRILSSFRHVVSALIMGLQVDRLGLSGRCLYNKECVARV